jgi:hypothetical protein
LSVIWHVNAGFTKWKLVFFMLPLSKTHALLTMWSSFVAIGNWTVITVGSHYWRKNVDIKFSGHGTFWKWWGWGYCCSFMSTRTFTGWIKMRFSQGIIYRVRVMVFNATFVFHWIKSWIYINKEALYSKEQGAVMIVW